MRASPWSLGAPLAVLAMTTAAAAQQAPAGPPPGLQNVPPPAQDATQQAREEQYAEQEARVEAARNMPQLQQNAAAKVDAERRAAYEQARPVIRVPSYPLPSSVVVVGVGTGARVATGKRGPAAVDVLATGAFPLADFFALFVEGGVAFRNVDLGNPAQVPVRTLRPVVGGGFEFVSVSDGARVAAGAALTSEFAVGSGRISSEPKTYLTPSAHLRGDYCALRYSVGGGNGCIGLGFATRFGILIPLGADGTGTTGTDKVRGVITVNIGPSVQF